MILVRTCLSLILLFALSENVHAQYTETINSNRPGQSQGAFAVGTQVIQAEVGYDMGNDEHKLLNTDINIYGIDTALRYGFWKEALEVNGIFRYQFNEVGFTSGTAGTEVLSGFETVQLGAKYLLYDPYKKRDQEGPNLYSYHANFGLKWRDLIPALAIYGGAEFVIDSDLLDPLREAGVAPTAAIITQNNWGRFVWVNNIIATDIGTDYPSYAWITTMTHSFSGRFAGFLEHQLIKGDLYADNVLRAGGAFLFTKDFQIDISGLINFKDTPKRYNLALGLSYRIDLHKKDEVIEDTSSLFTKKER